MRIITILLLLFMFVIHARAQQDTLWNEKPALNFSGFLDVFYVYDFYKPSTSRRQEFLYNHNRHNEFNLNLALLHVAVENPKYRANLALHAGTYSQDNYANESSVFRNIFEANVGIALHKKNILWLDVGILPSHIGFEGAISADNKTLTRSLLAENSPYFLTGAKLSYELKPHLNIDLLALNGWQRIQRLQGNSLLSVGSQLDFKAKDNLRINWSTFVGTDDPDATRRMRYFNNVYSEIQLTKKMALVAGFDFGWQQKYKKSKNYDFWFSPVAIAQYEINTKWKTAFRVEHYNDPFGVIVQNLESNGFQTSGLSYNVDYLPSKNLACRIETRWLGSNDFIFNTNENSSKHNWIIAMSLAIKFNN